MIKNISFFNLLEKAIAGFIYNKNFVPSLLDRTKYKTWSKNQLIEKLLKVESELNKASVLIDESQNGKIIKSEIKINSDKQKPPKVFNFSKYNTRFIALRFSYLGWNYNGLAIQKDPTPLPTVEGIIIDAMNKCKLVPSMNPKDYKFSRCGRTDKGVSAMKQVISLNVRSNLTDEEQRNYLNDSKEIQYVNILNQLLPGDIRISAVCLRPPKGFDARFSCEHRHYKYLFSKEGLDIEKMTKAALHYEGEHDFRNFCKLDGSKQITNYKRTIMSAKIMYVSGDFYCFDLVGSAFLWHQVRCMMANLFLVGQGLEDITLISEMLDISKYPQKPLYDMVNEIPLLLYDCKFPELEWIENNINDYKAIKYHKAVDGLALEYQLKFSVADIFKNVLSKHNFPLTPITRINLGDGRGKVVRKYENMVNRQVMEPYETLNQKFKQKCQNKI